MEAIQQIKEWRTPASLVVHYEKLLAAMGTEEFGAAARASVCSVTGGLRRLYLAEAKNRETSALNYFSVEPGMEELLPMYEKRYLVLDPIQDAYRAAPQLRDMALMRIRPADIACAGYRHRFFEERGIIERISIVQRGEDSWRQMNVARHVSDGYFSDVELNALVGLACFLLPMLPHNRATVTSRQLTVDQIEERFGRRYTNLTTREREVCARAAIGMTVEATALDLGIAKTSVLTYRQRAYQRLGVTSPYELSSLVSH
jgi:DNA-binding CsgD family transcriptional regulator